MQKLDTIGALFANSWKRFGERFAVTVAIFAVPAVFLTLARLLLDQKTPAGFLFGGLIEIVAVIVSIIASFGLISAYGNNTNFAESFAVGTKLFWSGIWIGILVCLATLGGLVMLIIPGIILMVQLAFTNYVLVLDGKHGMAAIAQSREYVKEYWWAVFGRMLLLILIFVVFEIVILVPLTLLLGPIAGVILYGVFLLFLSPFAISYEYEVFHNLHRLKPDVAERAAKADQGFVKVSMVVGIICPILISILIIAGAAFFGSQFTTRWHMQYPPANGYGSQSGQAMIDPDNGPIGTSVMINGIDSNMLGATETILMDNLVAARNVSVAADGSLMFTIPSTLAPNCDPTQACPQFLAQTSPKTYSISLEQNAEDPNPISVGTFTVVGQSISGFNPGGPVLPPTQSGSSQ